MNEKFVHKPGIEKLLNGIRTTLYSDVLSPGRSKLSEINYRMAIHEGDANRRLASQAKKIYLLFPSEIPLELKKDFEKLRKVIGLTISSLPSPGLTPAKIRNIKNSTAAKYLKLLLTIEHKLDS